MRPARAATAADSRPDPFASLNAQQREAAEHGLGPGCAHAEAGPLLVLAGAGTGKTLTLAARVARLVLAGADPQRILLLSFSRRAAHELAQRAGRLLHQALGLAPTQAAPRLPWAGTFHGVGARLLREYAVRIGLTENHTILDRADAEDLLGLVRHELQLGATHKRFPLKATCLAIYSRVLNRRATLAEVLHDGYPWCEAWHDELKALFRAYVAEKQRQGVLDYDDLLLYWAQMLDDAGFAAELAARFDHVLVDEYQDTNRLQAAILHALKPDGRGLTVVGDDAQAIYSFRGAEIENILGHAARYTPPARVITLERNYRSTQPLLDASNGVIALAVQGLRKRLWSDARSSQRPTLVTVADEAAQAGWVADEILRRREDGIALKRQAVLFRAAHHSAALELELARRDIPYVKFGGLKFLEAAHVKDVLSVLRWVQNPRSRMAGLRVAQLVPGIGTASAKRLLDALDAAADPIAALRSLRPPAAAAADWAEFLATHAALRAGAAAWPAELERVQAWYLPQLRRLHDDADARAADLAQLTRLAAGYGSRESFLAELTLDPPQASSDEAGAPHLDEDYLILSTIHSAKGQEWSAVYVLNVVDGCIPSDLATGDAAAIEEERRLLYVAMTRARTHLHLLVPQRFYVTQQSGLGDRHLYGSRTRFIPTSLEALFERPGAEAALDAADAAPAAAVIAPIDIGAQVRSLWA